MYYGQFIVPVTGRFRLAERKNHHLIHYINRLTATQYFDSVCFCDDRDRARSRIDILFRNGYVNFHAVKGLNLHK